jgi:hypothetical protein
VGVGRRPRRQPGASIAKFLSNLENHNLQSWKVLSSHFQYWKAEFEMDSTEARAALASTNLSNRKLAERAQWPLWRHAAFGLLEALLLIAWGLPTAAMAACLVLALVGLGWIVADDRSRNGFFVSGWSSKAAMPATIAACVVFIGAFALVLLTGGPNQWTPIVPLAAFITFVGCTLSSIWWERLYRKELLSGELQ